MSDNQLMFDAHPDALKLILIWAKKWMDENQDEVTWENFPKWLTETSNIELLFKAQPEKGYDDTTGPVYWSGLKFPKAEHVTQFLLQYGTVMKDAEL